MKENNTTTVFNRRGFRAIYIICCLGVFNFTFSAPIVQAYEGKKRIAEFQRSMLLGMMNNTQYKPADVDNLFPVVEDINNITNSEQTQFSDNPEGIYSEETYIPVSQNSGSNYEPSINQIFTPQLLKETIPSNSFSEPPHGTGEGIIGISEEFPYDSPADNVFKVSVDKLPNQGEIVWLSYDVYGVEGASGVSSSFNSNPASGGYMVKLNQEWKTVREPLNLASIKEGDNFVRFSVPAKAGYSYRIKNVQISSEITVEAQDIVFTEPEISIEKNGQAYLKGIVNESSYKSLYVNNQNIKIAKNGSFENLVNLTSKDKENGYLELKIVKDNNSLLTKKIPIAKDLKEADLLFNIAAIVPVIEKEFGLSESKLEAYGASVYLPGGALNSNVQISITELRTVDIAPMESGMANVTLNQKGFRFLPHGIKFLKDGKVSIPYDEKLIPSGNSIEDIRSYYFDDQSGHWIELELDSIDQQNKLIISKTNHFTDMINGVIQTPESPQTNAFAPTMMSDVKAADPTAGMNLMQPPSAAQDGAAHISYPINIPSGRNGMQPSLAVQYNSEGGNSWMGLGWNISVPAITLDTRWGVPEFASHESELYLLSGEQLVYPKTNSTDDAPYLPHRHTIDGNGHYDTNNPQARNSSGTKIFYLRKEGSFTKIERLGTSPGTYYWKVTSTDGTIYWYGGTETGIVATAVLKNDANNIVHWALTKTIDVFGNNTLYTYSTVSDLGGKQIYLNQISYTGKNATAGPYTVTFNRDASIVRPDVSIDGRLKLKQVDARRLDNIEVKHNSNLVRKYKFNYVTGLFNKSLLKEIIEYNEANVEFQKHTLKYHDDVTKDGGTLYTAPQTVSKTVNPNFLFNIDGLLPASIIGSDQTTNIGWGVSFLVGLAITGPFDFAPSQSKNKTLTFGTSFTENFSETLGMTSLIDIDGDGRKDIVYRTNSGLKYVSSSVGRIQNFSGQITYEAPVFSSEKSLMRTDGATMNNFSYTDGYSKSRLFENFEFNSQIVNVNKKRYENFYDLQTFISDGNGDGLPDIVDNGVVYFNRIVNGQPTFNASSFDTPNLLIVAETGLLENEYDESDTELGEKNYDAVRMWKAPFRGTIKIEDAVQILGTSADSRLLYTVETAHLDNPNNLYRLQLLDIADHSIHNYALSTHLGSSVPLGNASVTGQPIQVEAGQKIFFRVHNLGESNEELKWNPKITYLTRQTNTLDEYPVSDQNGKSTIESNYKNSFLLSNERTLDLPGTGTISINWNNINIVNPSDDVHYEILARTINSYGSNTETIVFSQTFQAGQNIMFYDNGGVEINFGCTGINVGGGDPLARCNTYALVFRVRSDSNVKWTDLEWEPTVVYQPDAQAIASGIPNESVTRLAVAEYTAYEMNNSKNLNISAYSNVIVKPRSGWVIPASIKQYSIFPNLGITLPNTVNGEFQMIIKKNNLVIGKKTIYVTEGIPAIPDEDNNSGTHYDNPIIVYSGNLTTEANYHKVSVEFYAKGQNNSNALKAFSNATQQHIIVGYDWSQPLSSNKFYKSDAVNFYYDQSTHGPLISNWGQFFYNESLNQHETSEIPSDAYGKLIDYELIENPTANLDIELLLEELDLDIDPDYEYTSEELDALILDALTPPGEGASEEEWNTYYNNMSILMGHSQFNPVQVASALRSIENGKRWIGIFSHQYIKDEFSYLGDIGDIFGDAFEDQTPTSEPMQVDVETGMFGLVKKSKTVSHSFLASVGINGFGVGISVGKSGIDDKGFNYSYTDFADINGDSYPDLLYSDKAQYTNMSGGHRLPANTTWGTVTEHASLTEGISLSYAPLNAGEFAFSSSSKESGDGNKNNKPAVPVSATIGLEGDLGGSNQTHKYWLDLNGDGLPELIKKDQSGNFRYWLNTGYSNSGLYNDQTFNGLDQYRATPGDVSANLGVSLSLSDMFGESLPDDFNFSFGISAGAGYSFSNTETSFIDINADGLVDLVKLEANNAYKVYLNKGNGFDMSSSNALNISHSGGSLGLQDNSDNVSFNAGIDFSFFIHPLIYSVWIIIMIAFVPVPLNIINFWLKLGISAQASASVTKSDTKKTIEDFDGDGYPDFIEKDGSSIKVYYSKIRRTNKLESITNPLGGKIELDYTVEGNTYDMPNGKWVLSQVAVTPSHPFLIGASKKHIKYFKYEKGYYDRREREFYGFETVKTMDLNASANPTNYSQVEPNAYRTQINRYHNKNYFFKGLLKESFTIKGFHNTPAGNPDYATIPTSKLFSKTINTYELHPLTNDHKRDGSVPSLGLTFDAGGREGRSTAVVTLKQTDNFVYELTTTPIQSRQIFTYDEYARIKNLDYKGDITTADDDYFSEVTYHNDAGLITKNILSVPKEIKVKSSASATDYLRRRVTENINLNTGAIGTIKAYYKEGTTELDAQTDMTYNADGKLATIIYPKNANNQRVQLTYEYIDGFIQNNVTKVTDNLGYNSSSTYEAKYGNLLTSTDINGNQVKYKYDTYGRLIQINSPKEPDQASQYTIQFEYHPNEEGTYHPYAITRHFDAQNPTNPIETYTFTDNIGRVTQVKKDVDIQTLGTTSSNEKMSVSGMGKIDLYGRTFEQYQPSIEDKSHTVNKMLETSYSSFTNPTITTYDELDRVITSTLPLANHTTTLTYTLNPDGFSKRQMETKSVTKQNSSTDITTYSYTDVNGRTTSVKNVLTGTGAGDIWTKYKYDKIGQLVQVIDNGTGGGAGNIIQSVYDLLGRRVEMTHPDAGTNKYWYDPAGNLTKMQTPNLLAYPVPATEQFIKYTYDALNRLTNITYPPLPATGNLNNVVYGYGSSTVSVPNAKGKLTAQRDATGKQAFEYGNMGELTKSTRWIVAPNIPDRVFTHQYEYDSWNRVNKITYPDDEQVTYKYDLGGNLLKMSGMNGTTPYDYIKQITYDHFEQRTAIKYGNNTVNTYEYSPELRRLHNAEAKQSNGDMLFDFIYLYDYVGNVTSFRSLTSPVTNKMGGAYSFAYSYDNLNRLKTSDGSFAGYNGTSPPAFEDLAANYTLAMEYDKLNNITKKTQNHTRDGATEPLNSYTHNYHYVNGKPHQLLDIQKGTTAVYENFVYDANGNTKEHTADSDWLYFWDESNRLRSAVQNEVKMRHYIYDAAGERTLKANAQYQGLLENGTTTDGGATLNGYTTYPSPYVTISSSAVYTKHYFAGSQRVASKPMGSASVFNVMGTIGDLQGLKDTQLQDAQSVADSIDLGELELQELDTDPGSLPPAIYYFHPDHLGSSTVITDGSGYAYQVFLNLPFGETMAEQRRTGTFENKFKFNGKELDSETGLYYYGARYYNPRTSVWLSVDPIALWQPVQEKEHYIEGQHNGGYFNPKNMSVYGYTYQNPIVYVDPNGKQNYFAEFNSQIGRTEHRIGLVVDGFKDSAKSTWEATKQLAQDWYVVQLSNSELAKQELVNRRFAEAEAGAAAISDWETTKSQLADFASTPYGQGYLVGAVLFAVVEPNSPPLKGFKAINGAVEIAYTVRRLNKSLTLFVPSGFNKVKVDGVKGTIYSNGKKYISPDLDMHKYDKEADPGYGNWKVYDSKKDLKNDNRSGTYDVEFNYIGK